MFSRPYSSTSHAVEASSHSCCWSGVAFGPPLRAGRQEDFEGNHGVFPAALAVLVHGIEGRDKGGNICGGSSLPIRIWFRSARAGSAFGVVASGSCAGMML